MVKNYFLIAIRNILRSKLYSFINIAGLAVGMACFILIMLWVQDEVSYDRYTTHADRLTRVVWDIDGSQLFATPGPFANWVKENVPGIQEVTRVNSDVQKFQFQEKKYEAVVRYIEPRFFTIFPFQFLAGDPSNALQDIQSVIVTESLAKKLFGAENPLGKLIYQPGSQVPFKVTAVVKDIPRLTHEYLRKTDCFLSFDQLRTSLHPDSWLEQRGDYKTYVLLNKGVSCSDVNARMNQEFDKLLVKYSPEARTHFKFILQPITQAHLQSDLKFETKEGNIQYVIFFSLIALVIMLMACVNFMNLTTARSIKRTREIGVRKVIGANRAELIKQFLGESILMSAFAFLIALVLVELFLPAFNYFVGKPLTLDCTDLRVVSGMVCMFVVVGIVSGSYPALFLSSFTPIRILKEQQRVHTRSSHFRRILVIGQFCISIVLIIGTAIIYQQLQYLKNKDLGFDKEHVVYLETEDFGGKYDVLKHALLQHPEITGVAASGDMLLNVGTNNYPDWEGRDKSAKLISFPTLYVNEDFAQTFMLRIKEGRFFSKEYPSDELHAFVVNEAAAKAMHLTHPVGTRFSAGREGQIIGVVKDFNFRSLRSEVEPLILSMYGFRHLYVRINSADIHTTIALIEQIYRQQYPGHEFSTHFFDQEIDRLYQSEGRLGVLFTFFSILAIIIACLGLFGLASFVAENMTKEIGIRKILGASLAQLISTLTKEFIVWTLLANVIAWPIAYIAMRRWLDGYAYRIDLSAWVFLAAGGLTLFIVSITICIQALKAAMANPVESLRYE